MRKNLLKKKRKRVMAGILLLTMLAQMFPLTATAEPSSDKLIFSADGGENTITVTPKQDTTEEGPEEIFNNGILDFSCDVITLDRDYAQTMKLKVTNKSEKMVQYYLEAENNYEDIYLNFVQEGSESAKMAIEPQETQEIELSVFLQNATEDTYRIPITAYVNDGEEGYWSSAVQKRILFHCKQNDFNVSIEPQENATSLQKTYLITNNGERITDFTLSAGDSIKDYLYFSPTIENYALNTGESVSVTVSFDLGYMKDNNVSNIAGELIASSGNHHITQPISYDNAGEIQEIEAWRLALYQEDSSYYTMEQPAFADNFENPNDSESLSLARNSNELTRDDIIELCHMDMDKGGISEENPISLTATYPYTDSEGNQQTVEIETQVYSQALMETPEPHVEYEDTNFEGSKSVKRNVVGDDAFCYSQIRAYVAKEQYFDALSAYFQEARDLFDIKGVYQEVFDSLWKELSGKDVHGGQFVVRTIIRDSAWAWMTSESKDYTGDILRACKGISKIYDTTADILTGTKYLSEIADPTLTKHEKDKSKAHLLTHMANLGIKTIKSMPQGSVSFFTAGPEKAIEIINTLDELRHTDMSDEEFGYYFKQQVYGTQCTNAGQVVNKVKWPNSLARGYHVFQGTYKAYYQIGTNNYSNSSLLSLLSFSRSKQRRSLNYTEEDFAVHPDANLVVVTGRMSNEKLSYTFQKTTNQTFEVNGTEIGGITTNGLSDLFNVTLVTDAFQRGENTVVRRYDTNPGNYLITTDTQYNILIPDNATLCYLDSLDTLEDIRCLPDFSVYAESIHINKLNQMGKEIEVPVTVYNRGPRGGWTDVTVNINGQPAYTEENVYVGPFGSQTLSFTMTPQKEKNDIEVSLTNKTEYAEERTLNNNSAVKVLNAKDMQTPKIVKISPTSMQLKETAVGACVSASFENPEWMQSVQFSLDHDAWTDTCECDGKYQYSALIPTEYLTEKDSHTLKVTVTYQDETGETKTVSQEITLSVKILKGISFTCVGRYPNVTLVEETDKAYEPVNGAFYDIDSRGVYDDKTEQIIYQETLFLDESYQPSEETKVFIAGDSDRIDLIPLQDLEGKEISGYPSQKVMITKDSESINAISVSFDRLNGKELSGYHGLDDTFYPGEGISGIHLNIEYSCNGYYQKMEKDLDALSSEQTICLQDTMKKIALTHASGDLSMAILIMTDLDGSESTYGVSAEQTEDGRSVIYFDDSLWQTMTNAKIVSLVCGDNSAIYQIDLKATEGSVDLAELKKTYHKLSYKESDAIIQKSLISIHDYDFDMASGEILAAPGVYQIKTDYTLNGVALHDSQIITVADQDVVLDLPENSSQTTVTMNWPASYDLVQVSYDSPDGWVYEQTVENGQKIVCLPGEQTITLAARLVDGSRIQINKTVTIAENTNTEINLKEQFGGKVTVLVNGMETPQASVEEGKSILLAMSSVTDEAGNRLSHYYQQNGMRPKLILTNVKDETDTIEIDADQDYYDLSNWSSYTFTAPQKEGTYRYRVEWRVPLREHEHVLQKVEAKEADCETSGNIEYYLCEECDSLFKDEDGNEEISREDILIPAKGHQWSEWSVTIPATEEQDGEEQRVCENNRGHIETRVIPKLTHTHKLVFVPEKEATYEEVGNIAYYQCECGRIFADENGEQELEKEDVVIPKLVQHVHNITKVEAKAATCEEEGNKEYYYCDLCDKYFEDAGAEQETLKDALIILPKGHDWGEWTITKEPTADAPGEMIRVCKNDNGHIERKEIPATGQPEQPDISYKLINSSNLNWIKGSNVTLPLFIRRTPENKGLFEHFKTVTVDGTELSLGDYDVSMGENPEDTLSIQLQPSYLQKLAKGEHSLQVIFDDGNLDVKFVVLKKDGSVETDPSDTNGGNQNSSGGNANVSSDTISSKTGDSANPNTDTIQPETGDSTNIALRIALMIASIGGLSCIYFVKRKKVNN